MHPKDIPVDRTFDVADVAAAAQAVEQMVEVGFSGKKQGFRVLMPKEKNVAKRIGYTITTGVSTGLRKRGHPRDIKYWTYHHDDTHYGIVLASSSLADRLGL